MARRPTSRQHLEAILRRFSLDIERAFLDAIQNIKDEARIGAIAAAIEAGEFERAIGLVGADAVAFRRLERAIADAFEGGGMSAMAGLPALRDSQGVRLLLRFDPGDPQAESWMRNHSSQLITRVVEDQRNAFRLVLSSGVRTGAGPRTTALDIVGRINRVTGRRAGGIVGLTEQQAQFVINARNELLSGSPEDLRAYLGRQARDRRFDRTVRNAIEQGRAIDQATIQRMTGRYSDRLLQMRGEVIARTEGTAAFNKGRLEAMDQALTDAAIGRDVVTKVWRATLDERTRDRHREMDGEEVGIDGTFSNGLQHPGDPAGNPEQIANCRCVLITRIGRRKDQQAA